VIWPHDWLKNSELSEDAAYRVNKLLPVSNDTARLFLSASALGMRCALLIAEAVAETIMRPKRSNKKVVCAPPLVTEAMHDLGVRQDAEKHLAQMENKYHGLLEAAPDAMVVVNQDGEIVLLNLQAEKQFGYRRDELLGQKVTNIVPKGFAERLIADGKRTAAEALAQQIGTGIELIARRKDSSEFPIEIMLSPLESAEGILVTAAIRNISVRKNMERLKDEFVSVVSHELRTPLTSISASLGLLMGKAGGDLPKPVERLIAIAHTNSLRLVRLVNDILDIEKMDSGQTVFNFGRVEVRPQVEQAIEANFGFAESLGVRIRLECVDPIDDVRADSDRLTQVITNLLSNAIKFSPPNSEVVVAIEKGTDVIRISVRDHGPGIPTDFKPRIFERLAQADVTNARHNGGTGLGLTIVKQIVDRLGGVISFADAPGGGTIFQLELPCWKNVASVAVYLDAQPDAAHMAL
jgi:PAS domain S-box-containing protein